MKFYLWDIYDSYGVEWRVVFADTKEEAEKILRDYLKKKKRKISEKIMKEGYLGEYEVDKWDILEFDYVE